MKATFKEPKWSGNEIVFLLQSEKNIDAEVEESYDFRSSIQETIAEIGSLMIESRFKKSDKEPWSSSTGKGPFNGKLPRLQLQKSAGNPIEWSSFWDSFYSALNDNPCFIYVDKFN